MKSGITEFSEDRILTTKRHFDHQYKRGPQCHYCKKFGYTQKNCIERIKYEEKDKQGGAETEKQEIKVKQNYTGYAYVLESESQLRTGV